MMRRTMGRSTQVLIVLGIIGALFVTDAAALSLRKLCRRECRSALLSCTTAGKTRKECRRTLLGACRRQGLIACLLPATTTSTSVTSTTTSPEETTTTTAPVFGDCTTYTERLDPLDPRTVSFTSFAYSPRCLEIRAGQIVRFTGPFSFHPLVPGQIFNGAGQPDATSPIPPTSFGTSINVTFPDPGIFPYYCDLHGTTNSMTGVVLVVP